MIERNEEKCRECGKPHLPGMVATYCLDCGRIFAKLIHSEKVTEEEYAGIRERKAQFAENP